MVAKTFAKFSKGEIRSRFPLNKRGYFFVVDAMLAATILFLGLFYLFTSAIVQPEHIQSLTTAQDFNNVLLGQPLYSSTNSYYEQTLLPAGLVPYPDATPLEEIAYLTLQDPLTCPRCHDYAYAFSQSMVDESLDPIYGAAISVNGTLIYNRTISKTTSLIARQAIVYVRLNATVLKGPLIAEVQVWY